jgi:hypothetical protein
MKNLVTTLVVLALIAGITCFVSYRVSGDPKLKDALTQGDALQWLKVEFKLTDAQFARIKTLHDSYSLECEKHCAAIQEAERAKEVAEAQAVGPQQLAELERQLEGLRDTCENAIAAHARRCAAEMSPEAGERYLALVLPKIADFDHQAPPDVRLNRHVH